MEITLDIAGFIEPSAESGLEFCVCFGSTRMQKSDHRHRRLLCARPERPRHRAAEQRYERAPFH
jgi:hypothetical protein